MEAKRKEKQTETFTPLIAIVLMPNRTCEFILRTFISMFAISFLCCTTALFATLFARKVDKAITSTILLSIASVVSLLIYLILCCFSETPRFLYNQIHAFNAYEYMHKLKGTAPTISMHIACYHYEERTYYEKNSEGKEVRKTETVRVDTYSETRNFNYQSWEDISDLFFLGVDEKQATRQKPCLRLYLKKSWIFTDEQTLYAYKEAKSRIIYENRWRDQYIQYSERMNIPGFKSYIMALVSEKKPPFFHLGYYILSVLFFMAVPYCYYIDYMSYTQDFTIQKRVSVLPKITLQQNFDNVAYYEREPSVESNPDYNPNAMTSHQNNAQQQYRPIAPQPPPHQYQTQQGYVPVEGDYILYQQSEISRQGIPPTHK